MKLRRFVMPAVLTVALIVGMFAGPVLAQQVVPQDFHTPSPEVEVEVAGVVLERQDEEAGVEVLDVATDARQLAVTGVDTMMLLAIGLGLIGLGVLSFRTGRRTRDPEGSRAEG